MRLGNWALKGGGRGKIWRLTLCFLALFAFQTSVAYWFPGSDCGRWCLRQRTGVRVGQGDCQKRLKVWRWTTWFPGWHGWWVLKEGLWELTTETEEWGGEGANRRSSVWSSGNGAVRKSKPQPMVCNKAEDEIGLNLVFKFHLRVALYLRENDFKNKSEQITQCFSTFSCLLFLRYSWFIRCAVLGFFRC